MKKLSILLVILILGLSLFSCGTNSGDKEKEKGKDISINHQESDKIKYVAGDLLDLTFAEVKEKFGDKFEIPKEGYDGSSLVIYENLPYSFAFSFTEEGNIKEDEKVGGVYVGKGGFITDKIKVGMTFKEIEDAYGSPVEIGEDADIIGDYFCAINLENKLVIFSAESQDGKTYSAMVKYKD